MSVRILSYRSAKGTVTTLMVAPVSRPKSGARRCSGSAIWGPVNVRTVTSTPLCRSGPVPWVGSVWLSSPPLQAAISSETAAMDTAQRENGRLDMAVLPCFEGPSAARSAPSPEGLYRSAINIRCLALVGSRRIDVPDGEQQVGVEPLVPGGDGQGHVGAAGQLVEGQPIDHLDRRARWQQRPVLLEHGRDVGVVRAHHRGRLQGHG